MTLTHKIDKARVEEIQQYVKRLQSYEDLPGGRLLDHEVMMLDLWTMWVREHARLSTTKSKARELLVEIEHLRVRFSTQLARDALDDLELGDTVKIDSDELERRFARRAK